VLGILVAIALKISIPSQTLTKGLEMNPFSYAPVLKLQTLSDEQLEKIHLASLEILEDLGMRFLHEGARELLLEHGYHR